MKFQNNIQQRLTGRHKKSFELVGDINGKIVLDVGCSFGWFEKFASENEVKEIIGIDTDEKNLFFPICQQNIGKLKILKASALDLAIFEREYFDIVVMWEVLEHLPKGTEEKALIEINKVLKHGGILYLSTPFKNFWSCILDPAWYYGHRHYSEDKLKILLNNTGFRDIEFSYGGRFCELFSMILLYIFKLCFKREIPFKYWFDKKRESEYMKNRGFSTIFLKARP